MRSLYEKCSYVLMPAKGIFKNPAEAFTLLESVTTAEDERILLFAVNCNDALEIPELFKKEDARIQSAVKSISRAVQEGMLGMGSGEMASLLVPSHLAHGINEMLAEGKLIAELPEELSATLSPAFELATKTPLQPGNHLYIKNGIRILA